MTRVTYSIRDWNEHFENSQSRKYAAISWVPVSNKHDGKSFRRLMRMPNGAALYGCWMLIVQVASKCPTRGVLADSDGPLSAEDISLKCDAPEAEISQALEVLSSPAIGWLVADSQSTGSTLPADSQTTTSEVVGRSEPATLNRIEKKELNTPLPPKGGDEGFDSDSGKPESPGPDAKPARPKAATRQLAKADLRDTAAVLAWLKRRAGKLNLDPEDYDTEVHALAAAELAMRAERPGYFEAVMRNQRWELQSDADRLAAKRRLAAHREKTMPAIITQFAAMQRLPDPLEGMTPEEVALVG